MKRASTTTSHFQSWSLYLAKHTYINVAIIARKIGTKNVAHSSSGNTIHWAKSDGIFPNDVCLVKLHSYISCFSHRRFSMCDMTNGNEFRKIDFVFCKMWNQRELRTFVVGSVIPMVSRSRSGWSLVVKPWESKVRSIVQGSSAMYVQSIEKIINRINHNSITIDAKWFWIHLKWVIYLLDSVQQKEVPFYQLKD